MNHEHFMLMAIEEAKKARDADELPIGSALVANTELICLGQTSVVRQGTIVAHGEIDALHKAQYKIYTDNRPLILYTTLEPCLMCVGAAMQCNVDMIVYGMRCKPDGAASAVKGLAMQGQKNLKIVSKILETECLNVFRSWNHPSDHPAFSYVQDILSYYE